MELSLEPAVEYARRHVLHALIVVRKGCVITSQFGEGYDAHTPHALYSGSKSFWGVAALLAQREGLLDVNERVAGTFPQWENDRWKRQVTLRQLLTLTAGIGFGGLGSNVPSFAKALAVELKNEPGTTFAYGGIPLQVFGAVLEAKLAARKESPYDYLRRRLLDPIGMRVAKWRTLADGSHPLPTGAYASAHEWSKYGRYICEHQSETEECFEGSAVNPRYGLGFWLGASGAPKDLVYASGAGGQALYIVPSLGLTVVRLGGSSGFKHASFLKRLFQPADKG